MTLSSGVTKRIFISDFHMGDNRGMKPYPPHPYSYGWLNKNISVAADFLHEQLQKEDISEVIILGDLFDQWVIPLDMDPLTGFDNICNNPANKSIVDNLKALAASPRIKLTYVPGNHDMSISPESLTIEKKFMQDNFPGINYICEDGKPAGVYRAGMLAAEHGDMYCLFNSPDTWTVPDSFLPLGYFITRLTAYKVAQTNKHENYLDILWNFIKEFKTKPRFIEDFVLAVAADSGLKPDSLIDMKEIGAFPEEISVSDISAKFKNLIINWDKNHKNFHAIDAMISEAVLSLPARKIYFSKNAANIVIFGHTHKYTMHKNYLFRNEVIETEDELVSKADELRAKETDRADEKIKDSSVPCKSIYANSGAWTDETKVCTYVETEEDPVNKRHYVRIKSYPNNTLLKEGFVEL